MKILYRFPLLLVAFALGLVAGPLVKELAPAPAAAQEAAAFTSLVADASVELRILRQVNRKLSTGMTCYCTERGGDYRGWCAEMICQFKKSTRRKK